MLFNAGFLKECLTLDNTHSVTHIEISSYFEERIGLEQAYPFFSI